MGPVDRSPPLTSRLSCRLGRRVLVLALLFGMAAITGVDAQAAEVAEIEADARAHFLAGVAAAEAEDWSSARTSFERSWTLVPRASTGYNLVVVNHRLDRPAAVVESAQRFFTVADPERHSSQWQEVEALQERAMARLGRIRLTVRPTLARLSLDGTPHAAQGGERDVWLEPGRHSLRVSADGFEEVQIDIDVTAGSRLHREITLAPVAAPDPEPIGRGPVAAPEPPVDAPPVRLAPQRTSRARRRVGLGLLGAGLAVQVSAAALIVLTWRHARNLRAFPPEAPGFLGATLEYRRLRSAAVWSAVGGGVVLSASTITRLRSHGGVRRWWLFGGGAAIAVVGAALAIRTPSRIGATTLTEPNRALGVVMLATSVPLLLAPIRSRQSRSAPVVVGWTGRGITIGGAF